MTYFTTKLNRIMKKILIIIGVGLMLASCRKDYACDCKAGDLTHTSTIKNKTLKEATDECNREGNFLGIEYKCNVNVFK